MPKHTLTKKIFRDFVHFVKQNVKKPSFYSFLYGVFVTYNIKEKVHLLFNIITCYSITYFNYFMLLLGKLVQESIIVDFVNTTPYLRLFINNLLDNLKKK